ncbi:MAG: T9SS type A sorting domain-containing protein [Saprospiraceae bacterium]|jgi:hypothetical protein
MRKLTLCFITVIGSYLLPAQSVNFADCITPLTPCFSSIKIEKFNGTGSVIDQLGENKCFTSGETENNSIWISIIIEQEGDLEFSIKPLKTNDDLDFIVYKNPTSCNKLKSIRCVASGENLGTVYNNSYNCLGNLGLKKASKDLWESKGCNGDADGYLSPIDVKKGDRVLIYVNNYSSKNGFELNFEGTCTFKKFEPIPFYHQGELKGGKLIYSFFNDANYYWGGCKIDWKIYDVDNIIEKEGASISNIQFTTSGIKTIIRRIINESGCEFTDSLKVYLRGLDQSKSYGDFYISDVYPSPASSYINLEVFSSTQTHVDYIIINAKGKELFKKRKEFVDKYKVITVPISGLTSGEYFIQVTDGNKNKSSRSFIIAK